MHVAIERAHHGGCLEALAKLPFRHRFPGLDLIRLEPSTDSDGSLYPEVR